ncbi:hypothetical protein E4K72_05780 [Oxalobacteraceae bacterium OM1]|nr:hypothetical protein E4K72_05780 [Oxalobacteraceae bacterium OM1]
MPSHHFHFGAPSRYAFAAVLALLGFASAHAATFDEDFDDQEKPWEEIAVQLPAQPRPENLLPFETGPLSTYRFAIDAKSLSVGSDGVVRYTLVANSSGGATNVSYEGIRCATYERKLYAFGHPDGKWSRSRRDQWERIASAGPNAQHAALFQDYFCEGKTVAGTPERMIDRLRTKRPKTPLNSN